MGKTKNLKRIGQPKKWETYEEVAQYLLNQMADRFNLGRVEGKQEVVGKKSGTKWEIDAKGVTADGLGFIVVECRRYTTSRLNQKGMGSLAWTILDTGAEGGIIVTPLDVQRGAKKVAASTNIQHVVLSPDSTISDYMMRFLNQIMVGRSEAVTASEAYEIKIVQDGIIVGERKG